MKQLITVFVLFVTLTTQAQTTKRDNIKALFTLMHQDSLVIKTMKGMSANMLIGMSHYLNDTTYTNRGINMTEIINNFSDKTAKRAQEAAISFINNEMVDAYDKFFTTEEINDFIAFYKTKSGQKWITQTPLIMNETMGKMTSKFQSDFQVSIKQDMEELTKLLSEK